MISKIKFIFYLLMGRYTEALAQVKGGHLSSGIFGKYACYRMGLYRTVVEDACRTNGWLCNFADLISFAACGRFDEVKSVFQKIKRVARPSYYRAELASSLAPYHPVAALDVVAHSIIPLDLKAALLLRAGRFDHGKLILAEAFRVGLEIKRPELYLYLSNAEEGGASEKLKLLNSFLKHYKLPSLGLRDKFLPVSASNLRLEDDFLADSRGPLVSILMTAFCVQDRIQSSIESMLAQTYKNIEIIVVDDASSDQTGVVVSSIADRDARVKYIRLPCNVGTYAAKTIGMRYAKGEFVTCHDADDWAHPFRIEQQVTPLINNSNLIFTVSKWVRIQDDGDYYARPVYPLMRINPASPMFRRERVVREAGLWDVVRTGADSEFYARLRLVFGRDAMLMINKPLTVGAHRVDSLTAAHDTGYGANGTSLHRIDYWESWVRWHIKMLRMGVKPNIGTNIMSVRVFEAPIEISVCMDNVQRCLDVLGLSAEV